MMMRKFLMSSGLGLACAALGAAHAQAYTNCNAQAERKWSGLTIEAVSQGDTCEDAVFTLVIRDKAGKPIWARAHIASQLLSFTDGPIASSKAMIEKLSGWISGEGFMQSADKLTLDGEFPFTVSSDIDQSDLKKYRKQKLPLFCYIQGMESGNCLAIDKDGGVVELGVQSFPG
jgi:hypothetical protein